MARGACGIVSVDGGMSVGDRGTPLVDGAISKNAPGFPASDLGGEYYGRILARRLAAAE